MGAQFGCTCFNSKQEHLISEYLENTKDNTNVIKHYPKNNNDINSTSNYNSLNNSRNKYIIFNDEKNSGRTSVRKFKKFSQSNSTIFPTEYIVKIQKYMRKYLGKKKYKDKIEIVIHNFNKEWCTKGKFLSNQEYSSYINEDLFPFIEKGIRERSENYFSRSKKYIYGSLLISKPPFWYTSGTTNMSNKSEDIVIYQGDWNFKTCAKQGHGLLFFSKQSTMKKISIYSGFFNNDAFYGFGVYLSIEKWSNSLYTILSSYSGEWMNSRYHGIGKEINKENGTVYIGNYLNGEKHGKGKFIFSNGDTYEGQFKNNIIEGYGEMYWKNNRMYKGTWINNWMEGKGELNFGNGIKYIGEFKKNKKEGEGILYLNREKNIYYKGSFFNDYEHGNGVFYNKGNEYKGVFRYGKIIKVSDNDKTNWNKIRFKPLHNGNDNSYDINRSCIQLQHDVESDNSFINKG